MEIKVLVVGLHHHNNDLVFDCGMPVSVVFDDHNEHSDCAFKVLTEGGLMGGYLAESQFYWGSLATRLDAKLSFELKSLVNQGYTISEAVVEEIRGRKLEHTKVVLKITLNEPETTSEEVVEPMEEDNMPVEVVGDREGLFTLVGVQYYVDELQIGQKVFLQIKNNTTYGVDVNGEPLGVFPQKDAKCDAVLDLGCPLTRNSEIKNDASSFDKEYIVVGFITETKGNKVSKYAVLQLKSVVEATDDNQEELSMENIIEYGFAKMGELKTLYDVENIVEPVVEPETSSEEVVEETVEAEALCSVEAELEVLNEEIKALMKEEEAIKAKREALMAKREELASINAKRTKLIDAIIPQLENLELPVLEAIQIVISSSAPEEDEPSSFEGTVVEKVHEGKKLPHEEWEEYVETYWKRGFDSLRTRESRITDETSDIVVKRFVKAIIRFNKKLWSFKDQGYDKVVTRYWIKSPRVLKRVCDLYDLSSFRLRHSCIMKDDDLSFFLHENKL